MSDYKPRISYWALCKLSGPLDTGVDDKDWKLLSAKLNVSPRESDLFIQRVELRCFPTGKSPTMMVLRAWQQTLRVDEDIPVGVLTRALVEIGRTDVVSIVDQLIKDGDFVDSVDSDRESLRQYRGQSPHENSYHGRSSESLSTHNPVTWFITFSVENRSAAVFLGSLLKKIGPKVLLDCPQLMAQQVRTVELFRQSMKIIIIYTPEYVKEVLERSTGKKSRLNTRFIYDLMCQEFENNHGQNHRFIPVIDHDRIAKSSIPPLFQHYPMQDANFICNLLQEEHRSGERKSSEEQQASRERKIYQEVCLERHEYGTK